MTQATPSNLGVLANRLQKAARKIGARLAGPALSRRPRPALRLALRPDLALPPALALPRRLRPPLQPALPFALSLALSLGFIQTAQASYFIATADGHQLKLEQRTHVLISGRGNDLGTAPQMAAETKAARLLAAFPQDQVLLVVVSSADQNTGQALLRRRGFGKINFKKDLLDSKMLMTELSAYKQIASIHIFGHSGIIPGIYLDGVGDNDLKWTAYDPESKRLVGHFTADSFVTLNGCNGGQLQGPILSRLWGVPVAATLTSTHFETLFKDGNFYWADWDQRANMVENSDNYLRLRPDNGDYGGHFGHYGQGLAFFKFFCAGLTEDRCLRGMARSIRVVDTASEVTAQSTQEQYLQAVREWICPTGTYGSPVQAGCMKTLSTMTLESNDAAYTPYAGHSAHCDFNGCLPERCEKNPDTATACSVNAPESASPSTTFVDEYLSYLKAFQYFPQAAL